MSTDRALNFAPNTADTTVLTRGWRRRSRMGAVLVAVVAVLGALLVPAPAYAADDASIAGTIRYSLDSAPVDDATIEVFDAAGAGLTPVATATSDAGGGYLVEALPAGDYRIRVAADPALFMPQWYSGKAGFDVADIVTVSEGQQQSGVDLYLTDATDSIAGTIRYALDSSPIADATVEFYDAAGAGVTPVATVTTDGDGAYVVANLPYATYRVRVAADPALYMPQWFSSKADFDAADGVVVVDGTHQSGVDLYLTDATDSIAGTIRFADDSTPIAGATVRFYDAAGLGTVPVATVTSGVDGGYLVENLPYASYAVHVSASSGLDPQWFSGKASFAAADLVVIADGIHQTGIDLYLQGTIENPTASVSGAVMDGESATPLAGATVAVFDAAGSGITPLATTSSDANGLYSFTGLTPGTFRVRASAAGLHSAWYVDSTSFADASDIALPTGGSRPNVDFTLYSTTNALSGTVRDFDTTEPLAGVSVELYPSSPGDATPLATTSTAADGRYSFSDVAAGSYLVFFSRGLGAADHEWYAGAATRDAATAIELGATAHLTGIDASLGDVPLLQWETTPNPEITGTPASGSTLGITIGTWAPVPSSYSYQWLRDGGEIAGATNATYVLTAADRGSAVAVTVTAHKAGYPDEARTSAAVEIAAVTVAELAAALDVDGTMVVSVSGSGNAYGVGTEPLGGFPRAGGSYAVLSTGRAADVIAQGVPDGVASTTQGNAAGVDGHDLVTVTVTMTPPPGAGCLAADFLFGSEEFPEFVGTQYNDVFTAEAPTSALSIVDGAIVAPNNFARDTGGRIISINSVVSFAPLPTNIMDGWTTGLTARVPLIATGGVYRTIFSIQDLGDNVLDSAVLLDRLRYLPTADCAGGATPIDPIIGVVPVIEGTATACTTFGVTTGVWGPAPVTLSYQWNLDGVAVAGETGPNFTGLADAAGKAVTVTVTGQKPGYLPVSLTSAATAPLTLCSLTGPVPTISGTAAVGATLTASAGTWAPNPVALSYQWFRGGAPIAGATGTSLVLTATDAGTSITVAVTGTKSGYTSLTRTSAATAVPGAVLSPTPVPTITGTVAVGSTLTAVAGTWGPAPVALSYQWLRGSTPISGATSASYVLGTADLGASIRVAVTGAKSGFAAVTQTSAATAVVVPGTLAGPIPTISGSATVGSTLTATAGVWGPAPVSLSYQWLRGGVPIAGATGSSLLLTATDAGTSITVVVTGAKPGYTSLTRTSAAVSVVAAVLSPAPVPTITGTAAVGSTLTATAGVWGPAPVSLSYQWLRAGVPIAGATASTVTLGVADLATTITVAVTGSKAGYATLTKTSAATLAVVAGTLTAATPTITGTAAVGSTLTATAGVWGPAPVSLSYQWLRAGVPIVGATAGTLLLGSADLAKAITVAVTGSKSGYTTLTKTSAATALVVSNTLTGPTPTISGTARSGSTLTAVAGSWTPAPVTLSYQWLRSGVPIVGATASTLSLGAADLGKTITVTVTGSKTGYASVSKTSAATAAVLLGILTAPTPTISGSLTVGALLTAVTGTWAPAPVALSYRWLRNGVVITGATLSSYRLVAADLGAKISVQVTGTKTLFQSVTRTSAQTLVVGLGALVAPIPTVSGTLRVGSVVTVNTGSWGPAPVALSYRWLRNGITISGATGSSYTLVVADLGKTITVAVTGTKAGYTTATRTSVSQGLVLAGILNGPTPTISGVVKVGSKLTASIGTWSPAPVVLSYQWLASGVVIAGATTTSFTPTTAFIGKTLQLRVTGAKSGYSTLVRSSAATVAVPLQQFTAAPVPTISGTLRVGNTLTAIVGTWSPGPTAFAFQWKRNGVNIPGATGKTWLLNGADYNTAITVVVTGSRSLYATTARTSLASAKILPGFMIATPMPWITGTAKVGQILQAHTGQWLPAPVPVVFTWMRNGVAIPGASGGIAFNTYKLVTADLGKKITLKVTSTKTGYISVTKITAATATVVK